MFSEGDFGYRIYTKTDRRARRRAKAIEAKRNQQVPDEPEIQATIGLTKEERKLKLAERVHSDIREQYNPMRLDASTVTNYVGKHGGMIKGSTLGQLYEQLALDALHDQSEIGAWRAEVAVAYACSSNWLVRKQASEASEWVYTIPEVEMNNPKDARAELAAVA